MSGPEKKQKYKPGKAFYQQRLKNQLDEALSCLKNANTVKFAVITAFTWQEVSTKQDKKEIDGLVEKRIDNDETRYLYSMYQFHSFVEADPYGRESYKFLGNYNRKRWYEIYNLMREALAIRYAGPKTTVTEGDMQEGLDEGSDEPPPEDFKGGDSYE